MKSIAYLLLLSICTLSIGAQTEIAFYSELMKEAFIDAGADLNGDGQVTTTEAAQVTELFFDTHPLYDVPDNYNLVHPFEFLPYPVLGFQEFEYVPPYRDCNEEIPNVNDDLDGDGIPHYHCYSSYPKHFQGLEHFTSLKHLGIINCDQLRGIQIPESTETIILLGELMEPIAFPENSALEILSYGQQDSEISLDLTSCQNLRKLAMNRVPNEMLLPSDIELEYFEAELHQDSSFELSDLDLSQLIDLRIDANSINIDVTDLPSLERLTLYNIQDELSISNSSIKEIELHRCRNVAISNCPSLEVIDSSLSHLSQISNNSTLQKVQIKFDEVELSELLLTNCPNLIEIILHGCKLDNIDISELHSLTHLSLERMDLETLTLDSTPNLEFFLFQDLVDTSTILNCDFSQLEALEYLRLNNVVGETLDLSGSDQLRKLQVLKSEYPNIITNSDLLSSVLISMQELAEVDFSENFDPRWLALKNVNSPEINGLGFQQLERLFLHNTTLAPMLLLDNADNLETIYLAETLLDEVSICSVSDSLFFSIRNTEEKDHQIKVRSSTVNELQSFCTYGLNVDLYSCNGTLVDQIESNLSLDIENAGAMEGIRFFPNPVVDYVQVSVNHNTLTESTVTVYSLDGKIVKEVVSTGDRIYLGDLAPNIYFIELLTENRTYKQKLIVL